MTITLYHAPMSCSLAARLALVEGDLDHELVVVDTSSGEHRGEVYRRINPLQRVPVLAVNGNRIRENSAILPLIADLVPEAELLPPDFLGRAQVASWIGYIATELHPSWSAVFHPGRVTEDADGADAVRGAAIGRLSNAFDFLEHQLVDRQWLTGEMRICDLYLAVLSAWRMVPHVAGRLPEFPRLSALQQAVFTRPKLAPVVADDMKLRAALSSQAVIGGR
ncbi:hypothetical protein C1T17_11045 [Sphingobium sp. SCG-1]|uniref:glutathione S-transferase family protein n=1 Tax=Sphingobium sp. SCG-1 TaxID=2072936 RepID=UPI000CD688D3|nr:glutathione S-transferase N-terminal domain-containing protein [Sphingobium sp. SCG-1]AUW58556.1 hypothetical protein C1T17_11045 [Sphingobium sp. SCG-1]